MKKCLFLSFFLFLNGFIFSAPYDGEMFHFHQPDQSLVTVRIFGDEYFQDAEGLDGYTLVRDQDTGWICYAMSGGKGGDYLSSGIPYRRYMPRGDVASVSPDFEIEGLLPHLRLSSQVVKKKAEANYRILNEPPVFSGQKSSAPRAPVAGTITGLTVLVDFPDCTSPISRGEISDFLNLTGYSHFSNNGSIKDFFFDVSEGQLIYTNEVTSFVTMSHEKAYYDSGTGYGMVSEFLYEAMDLVQASGFDFSSVSTSSGEFIAVNFLYAGSPDAGWGNGLWPHQGTKNGTYAVDGIRLRGYQISYIGTQLSIGTFCHESGHLLCGWDDLYAYDSHDKGIGRYGLMCLQNSKNPQMPNPYFRYLAGWIDFEDIASASPGTLFSAPANGPRPFRYAPGGAEFFLIEARTRTGRSLMIPDQGLLIWHIFTRGDNKFADSENMVSIEQADGLYQLENNINSGEEGDLFYRGYNDRFNDFTSPSACFYSGSDSGLDVAAISDTGEIMTFSLGLTVSPELVLGDVDGSSVVDILDALMTARYYVGFEPQGFNPDAGDVNRSGEIEIVDALMIAQFYIGLISSF